MTETKLCPKCGEQLEVDWTPEIDSEKPFEIVCYACGWFLFKRFFTEESANQALKGAD